MKSTFARGRIFVAGIATIVAATGLSACGSGSQDAASTGAEDCDVSRASATVDQWRAAPAFKAPGPAFDATKAQGKTIFNIPLSSSNQFDNAISTASKVAAERAGVKFVNWPNQGQPTEWRQGIETAISQHADLILLEGGPDPKLLGPQLAAAKAAGIEVVSAHLYDESQAKEVLAANTDLSALVPAHHNRAGELMASYVLKASKCKANVLFMTADDVSASQGIEDTFVATMTRDCRACKTKVVNVSIASWAQNMSTEVQSALTRDPSIDWVVPVYAFGMPFVTTGVRQANAAQRVKSVSYGGTASVNQMIHDKAIIVGQVGESPEWNGWANVDQALRLLSGVAPAGDENVPHRIIDNSNVDETGNPSKEGAGFGDASVWEKEYLTLWGIK